VRVIEGKYKGETGLVTDFLERYALVSLDLASKEIKIFTNHLKLKSEIDSNLFSNMKDGKKGGNYNANDLVGYNNNKHVGVVL